ncbi:hypothetical protein HMPREF0973_00621 [Prevotella veroralis F0319]|uniref:Uncharacterized protein n=1 Tax=Prevotella veroralis F0319 TaxID=649761 RepID=C9MLZ5_9BACT|nr:hypothetical protein HMPREF0973_00621 [Prevotella veroralis F0319]
MSVTKTREVFSLPNVHYAYYYYYCLSSLLLCTLILCHVRLFAYLCQLIRLLQIHY